MIILVCTLAEKPCTISKATAYSQINQNNPERLDDVIKTSKMNTLNL